MGSWDYTEVSIRSRFGTVDGMLDHRTVNPGGRGRDTKKSPNTHCEHKADTKNQHMTNNHMPANTRQSPDDCSSSLVSTIEPHRSCAAAPRSVHCPWF